MPSISVENAKICAQRQRCLIIGIELADTEEVFCKACAQAKPHRKPFPQQAENHTENFGDLIHMDLWGPASIESINHKRYTLDFKDDATRWTDIDYLATKDLSLKSYQTFEKSLEVQHGDETTLSLSTYFRIFHTNRRHLYHSAFDHPP
jgi:hypothetical protein